MIAVGVVALVGSACLLAGLARRFGLSEPLVLTIAGLIGSYIWFVPDVELTPDLVLLGILPPLLYSAAIRTSLVEFKENKRPILLLSVGLVLFTVFVVAAVVWWLLPVPFAVAVAVGAVVAPPDAVAATAVARRVGMPRRIVTMLEGESLFNDATALVTLRTSIAAFSLGTLSLGSAAADFAIAAGGGALIGAAIAMLIVPIRRRISDPVIDTALSFLAPFIAYLPAEKVHASGVISVVTCGLILGHGAPVWQSAASRIAERTNWRTVEFILESTVFLIIGLQVRSIVDAAWNSGLPHNELLIACVGTLLAVILARIVWMFPATYLPRMIPKVAAKDPAPSWRYPAVVAWAGMRGVVTLAAALLLPEDTPQLPVIMLLALVVVGGTLVLQGTSLPWLVRLLDLRAPSRAEDALQQANVLQRAANAGLEELDRLATPDVPEEIVASLRTRIQQRTNAQWERLGPTEASRATPSQIYRELRLAMLAKERETVLEIRNSGQVAHEVLQQVMATLDIEESMIDRIDEAEDEMHEERLEAGIAGGCEHLSCAPEAVVPDNPSECSECIEQGLQWVHLRLCLTCGHVACCSSSPGNHAEKHAQRTGHPVIRSFEAGESWRWCYPHNLLG
ncbi:Na+/H+ antiporter [Smaragdicoccus niigatensis]|uniref:Na+/H+ antiporter n=1 Tax=Smaragdicoccus niigatensis TaxID=359359 RepID=UPI00035F7F56|nr:Na+/H+ antiporter [Smaragdicoccus niigatensis]